MHALEGTVQYSTCKFAGGSSLMAVAFEIEVCTVRGTVLYSSDPSGIKSMLS